jgi:uncharacterized protein (DUF433 family)
MTRINQTLFNTGIYAVPDAARLSGVSTWRIRRWLRGSKFRTKKKEYHSRPLWNGQLQPIGGSLALGFLDLIEIRFVDAFLRAGVSWTMLRKAHERGVEMFQNSHPFCSHAFATDGRQIFVELVRQSGEPALLEIVNSQQVFAQLTRPFLKELEFAQDTVLRWRPATTNGLVVLDPTRNFGRPIVTDHGVPTEILAASVRACGSVEEVSRWYEVPKAEIEDAVEFEMKLAA